MMKSILPGLSFAASILQQQHVVAVNVEVVKDFGPVTGRSLDDFVVYTAAPNGLMFVATDNDHGREFWASDGTSEGTFVVDVNPGPDESSPYPVLEFSGLLYFGTATYYENFRGGLWATDTTQNGSFLVHEWESRISDMIEYDGELYFGTDTKLWKVNSNGSAEIVKDFAPSTGRGVGDFVVYSGDNKLFLLVTDDAYGREFWVSDGTSAGTNVLDINQGPGESFPGSVLEHSGLLYFGTATYDASFRGGLWATDGTLEGSFLVQQLDSQVEDMIVYNDELYFATDDKLWRVVTLSDVVVGAEVVMDFQPITGRGLDGLVVYNGKLMFAATDDSHGREYWISDGTSAGTRVLDINPGPGESSPGPALEYAGLLYFGAATYEPNFPGGLWATDGTSEGSFLVQQLDSQLNDMIEYDGDLYFVTDTVLWKVTAEDVSSSPPPPPSLEPSAAPSTQPTLSPTKQPTLAPTDVPDSDTVSQTEGSSSSALPSHFCSRFLRAPPLLLVYLFL